MTITERRPRLRRSDCSGPGIRRERRGRGFTYRTEDGAPIRDPEVLERLRALAIPPAWSEVWICRDELGHLQATGLDAAGRKQYLYHPLWRERRDRQKFDRMLDFAQALPTLRHVLRRDLDGEGLGRERVLACAVRMLDVGLFRVGSEEYAKPSPDPARQPGLGLTTITRRHVTVHRDGAIEFDYPAKSGVRRRHTIRDEDCREIVSALKRRRGAPEELLAYRDGRRWAPIHAEHVNEYLKAHLGGEFSAKDFRTWNATVLAAIALAVDEHTPSSQRARKRVIDAAVREVSEMLGNTPAVARRSYVDPRVFDRYASGWTIHSTLRDIDGFGVAGDATRTRIERAVLDLVSDNTASPAVVRIEAATTPDRRAARSAA